MGMNHEIPPKYATTEKKHVYKADCAYSCIYIYGVYVYANVLCSKRYILCILHGVYVNVYVTVYTYIYICRCLCICYCIYVQLQVCVITCMNMIVYCRHLSIYTDAYACIYV